MSSFVFNDFKKRYLNGEVPSADHWTFIPVNESFKTDFEFNDIRLDHYRSLSDFRDVSNSKNEQNLFTYSGTEDKTSNGKADYVNVTGDNFKLQGTTLYSGCKVTYKWTKVIEDHEFNNKPFYVTTENYETFLEFYQDSIKDNPYIPTYLSRGGFYFIRSKDELEWFAERSNYNNTIIGVIGDNLEGVINKPIGVNEDKPFNGILDGNYYTLDISIKAQSTDNGVVGILGPFGIVRNFKLINSKNVNSITCEKGITLSHIKNDGRDVNCGLLVGRNYGLIENIDAKNLGNFNIFGCVPSVYSVTNKSDDYKWNETDNFVRKKFDENNENFMFLNSFCINSPGNICPYVGYFNEGKFADDACGLLNDLKITAVGDGGFDLNSCEDYFANWGQKLTATQGIVDNGFDLSFYVTYYDSNQSPYNPDQINVRYRPLGNYYVNGYADTAYKSTYIERVSADYDLTFSSILTNKALKTYLKNPLYYGFDNFGFYTVRGVGKYETTVSSWIENYNSNLCQKALGTAYSMNSSLAPGYETTRCSMRMHPQARAAYNVGIIIGSNYGTANNIQISAIVKNTSNFVGFIGGLAGKQSYGQVNNVIVSMDNELVYDLGSQPEYGDIVYYKQTPVFPDVIKNYIQGKLNDTVGKNNLINWYCKPWYDENRDDANTLPYTCNTAQTVTDDVISYKLRPIFVVGGLFGRYVPSYGSNSNYSTLKTFVNNSTVLYKDNYSTTNEEYKRAENAFGVLAGKVDYATNSYNFYYEAGMACNNCEFSALSFVGEPFKVYGNNFDGKEWVPVGIDQGNGTSALDQAHSVNHYVGVYELKYNTIDPVVYTVNGSLTAKPDGSYYYTTASPTPPYTPGPETGYFPKDKRSLSEQGIYWAADYPIDLSSHNGGMIKSHNMFGFVYADDPDLTLSDGNRWDVLHKYYNAPNFDTTALNGGYNKRNMASKLIALNNCYSNIDNWIQLYDDYMNQWNYMKLPSFLQTKTAFDANEIYIIQKYWNRVRTKYNGYVDVGGAISSNISWDNASASLFTSAIPNTNPQMYVSSYFREGLLNSQIYPFVSIATQNTYDGYTTVQYQHFGWYNTTNNSAYNDTLSNLNSHIFSAFEVNGLYDFANVYNNPRKYEKNILTHYNMAWNVSFDKDIVWYDRITYFPQRQTDDTYYYYTYNTTLSEPNQISNNFNTLTDAFAFTLPITFTAENDRFGYSTPIVGENDATNDYITIGQYFSPAEIRNNIEKSIHKDDKGYKYFTTTSVSSDENFGGLLVVDSSGRNVMFMDNENNMPITGNSVAFKAVGLTNINKVKDNKLVLSV